MISFMQQRCVPYAILGRLYGCFFVHNFWRKSLGDAHVTWKSLYTVYSFGFFVIYLLGEIMFATSFASDVKDVSDAFSRYLLILVHGVVTTRVLANSVAMLTKPDKLLTFFRKSEAFEKDTAFSLRTYSLCSSVAHRWNAMRAFAAFLGLTLSYSVAIQFLAMEHGEQILSQMAVLVKLVGFIMTTGFFVYDSMLYLFLRSCINVLVEYTRFQLVVFREQNVLFRPGEPSKIEAMRLCLNEMRKLKELLNDIWAGPLIVACASTVITDCVILDAMFYDGMKKELWIIAAYALSASLSFIDLACTGQTLIDEARKLKSAMLMVRAHGKPDRYLQQLRYLYESFDPEGMCLDGGGFFVLRKSLLVPMTGSIIIFAVILVQTSNTVALKFKAS